MRFLLSAIAGVLLAAVGFEAALQLLPVNSGVRMAETTPATPYARYRPQQPYVYSYGWAMNNLQHGVTNRQGFSNSKDFRSGAQALVIGDSFIESFMVAYADTVQGRLDAALGGAYAAAASGNGLADALQLARVFLPVTQARTVVLFVEPWDLRSIELPGGRGHNYFTFGGSGVAIQHEPYVESPMKARALKSALLRYAYYNLKLPDWMQSKGGKPAGAERGDVQAQVLHRQKRDAALAYLMTGLNALREQYGTRFVFLVDGDRNALYAGGKSEPNWPEGEREALLASVQAHRFDVIDMQPVFADHWRRYRERLDSLPMDGHWNKVAHGLAAQQVLAVLARGCDSGQPHDAGKGPACLRSGSAP